MLIYLVRSIPTSLELSIITPWGQLFIKFLIFSFFLEISLLAFQNQVIRPSLSKFSVTAAISHIIYSHFRRLFSRIKDRCSHEVLDYHLLLFLYHKLNCDALLFFCPLQWRFLLLSPFISLFPVLSLSFISSSFLVSPSPPPFSSSTVLPHHQTDCTASTWTHQTTSEGTSFDVELWPLTLRRRRQTLQAFPTIPSCSSYCQTINHWTENRKKKSFIEERKRK